MKFKVYLTEFAGASETTRYQESLHCVGFALRQMKGSAITFDDMIDSDKFGKAYQKYCNVDVNDVELYDFLGETSWAESVIEAVNAVAATKWLKKKYVFHRNSAFMNSIYNQFNKLKTAHDIKLGNDKWNPSDIWASTIDSIPVFDDLAQYNEWISKQLKSGVLVGISLKKVKGKAKVEWQGPTDEVSSVGFKGVQKPSGRVGMFTTGVQLLTDKPGISINFRSFRISKQADITGEIIMKGGGARHGKVPASVKNKMIKDHNIPQMSKKRISDASDSQLKSWVQNLWKQCGHNFSDSQVEKDWESRKNQIQDRVGFWQSLIHGLELAAFMNTHKGKADQIMNEFYVGAKSTGGWSSEFIKVY